MVTYPGHLYSSSVLLKLQKTSDPEPTPSAGDDSDYIPDTDEESSSSGADEEFSPRDANGKIFL